jgi:tRNA nucleotidyltransferase (CCA-adding enzyme)
VYLVGGAVRDAILGRPVVDLDLAVDGPLAPVLTVLGGEAQVNGRFETATVLTDGIEVDLARCRRERYPAPGALPVVEPAPLTVDLRRRDFTVNALAVPLAGGELVAADHALEDLSAGRLRVLHEESFRDDPTRLFRLARYAARLDFAVEPRTLELLLQALDAKAVATVSRARVGNELRLLASDSDPIAGFAKLTALGVAAQVAPGFGLQDRSLAERALRLLPDGCRRDLVVLGACLLGVAADGLRELLDELEFPAGDRELLVSAATRAEKLSYRLEMAGPPSEIDLAAAPFAPEVVALAGAIHPAGAAREWLVELRHKKLSITGEDLIAAGIAPGPAIGRGLAAARAAMLDWEAPDRESQLRVALAAAGGTAQTTD